MISVRRLGRSTYGLASPHYLAALHATAKSIPGMWWNAPEKAWCGYADAVAAAVTLLKSSAPQLQISGAEVLISSTEMPENLSRVPALQGLYDYQKEAVRFCLGHLEEGVILGLDLGLGKSATTLRVLRAVKGERAIVTGPAFLSSVWEDEAAKWKEPPVRVLRGGKPDLGQLADGPAIVYCNWAIIHAWGETLIGAGYRILVLEECHQLQGENSRRAKALRQLRANCIGAIALTGTPVPNRSKDLWLLSDILSPGRFGKFFGYGLRYCAGVREQVTPEKAVWKFDGRSNEEELAARLRHFMFRRTKSQVARELPPQTRQIIKLDVGRHIRPQSSLLDPEKGKIDRKALRASLDAAADRKLPQVVDIVANHVSGGHAVIVFTYRRAVAEHITDALKAAGLADAVFIHGGLVAEKRRAVIAKKPPVLCATIDSAGVGIDLSYADVVVFAELTYEPHELLQAEARAHRRGQTRNVLVQYLIARGSSDELICSTVINKLGTIEAVVGKSDDGLLGDLKSTKSTEEVLSDMRKAILKGLEEDE